MEKNKFSKGQLAFIRDMQKLLRRYGQNPKDWSFDYIPTTRPTIVCLCGSTRFLDAYKKASLEETIEGKIVLSIGCDMRTDKFFVGMSGDTEKKIKDQLDELHLRKIDLADEVLILNVNGYIGESTLCEIAYAKTQGKRIRYLEEV